MVKIVITGNDERCSYASCSRSLWNNFGVVCRTAGLSTGRCFSICHDIWLTL